LNPGPLRIPALQLIGLPWLNKVVLFCLVWPYLIVFVHFIATPAQGDIDDEASIARHSKRLHDELRKSSPEKKVINELMDAEFSARRSFITKTDVRTRMRDTVAKYHILRNGNEVLIIINDSYAQKWLFCVCYKQ